MTVTDAAGGSGLGYLSNTYPVPSGTFIRGEILAHEAVGRAVMRYAIRPFDGTLFDPTDREEQARTRYLLKGGLSGLIGPALAELAGNPLGWMRAFGTALAMTAGRDGRRLYNFAYFLEAVCLKRWAEADGIAHLHTHFSTNSATVAMLARRLGGPEYSFTVHGPDELPLMRGDGIFRKLRHARFAVAITEYAKAQILAATGGAYAEKIRVIRCGIDLGTFSPAPPVAAENQHLVCIGRLCPQKAQVLLVQAAAALRDTHPDLRLTLIGDGETRGEIEALIAREDLGAMVTLHGWGSAEEVRRAIAASRALVLPSEAEGLPMVIMETMALARPVISTTIAGIPELLDDTCGWIIPARDLSALVGALRDCLAAPPDRLAALGAEGRARVERLHDRDRNAAELRAGFCQNNLA